MYRRNEFHHTAIPERYEYITSGLPFNPKQSSLMISFASESGALATESAVSGEGVNPVLF